MAFIDCKLDNRSYRVIKQVHNIRIIQVYLARGGTVVSLPQNQHSELIFSILHINAKKICNICCQKICFFLNIRIPKGIFRIIQFHCSVEPYRSRDWVEGFFGLDSVLLFEGNLIYKGTEHNIPGVTITIWLNEVSESCSAIHDSLSLY